MSLKKVDPDKPNQGHGIWVSKRYGFGECKHSLFSPLVLNSVSSDYR